VKPTRTAPSLCTRHLRHLSWSIPWKLRGDGSSRAPSPRAGPTPTGPSRSTWLRLEEADASRRRVGSGGSADDWSRSWWGLPLAWVGRPNHRVVAPAPRGTASKRPICVLGPVPSPIDRSLGRSTLATTRALVVVVLCDSAMDDCKPRAQQNAFLFLIKLNTN
jgi:hypothetical protein